MKGWLVRTLVTVAALVPLGFGLVFSLQQLHAARKAVPTTRVQKGSLELDVNTVADLRTSHSAVLMAPSINGALQIVHLLNTGTPVKAGDTVIEFDPSEQEYNLEQSRSQLSEAEQEIVKEKADAEVKAAEDKVALVKAKFDVRRAELAVEGNELVSEIDAKKNLLALDEAKRQQAQLEQDINSRAASNTASLALLEEKRQTALLGMQQAQHGIDNMKLKAPIDGLVYVRDNVDANGGMNFGGVTLPQYREGDLVNSGRTLAEVLDLTQMEAVAKIFENDRPNVSIGQGAEIHIDAQPGAVFSAKVKTIAGMASRRDFGVDAVRRFDVTFGLLSHTGDLRPGTSAQVLIRGTQVKDQLYLPGQCLFDRNGKTVVFVKRGASFEAVEAKIKYRTENRFAVENLPEGTEVALVNPEQSEQEQLKKTSSSPVGVGQ